MRDGSGEQMLILFRKEGCVINGFTQEAELLDREKLNNLLPDCFKEFIFGEPVCTIGTTFCLWMIDAGKWETGGLNTPDDLSDTLLSIFDGRPETYIEWADEYYFEGEHPDGEIPLEVVRQIYQGKVLTKEMVLKLTDEFEEWEQLKEDLEEIGYPFAFKSEE
ncbi:MAG: hypothetical protein LIP01_12155 [Tannerellaceae bacterium]|nr:hypothetical protein [Tannerellaceae bacterium]